VIDVRDFGAVGDGETDDYEALQKAADYLSRNSGRTLVFPPGTYRIDQYIVRRSDFWNGVSPITYTDCSNIRIVGCDAVIDVKGDFPRDRYQPIASHPGLYLSDANQVVPFYFVNCSDFTLEGFELNGHVSQMTRDPNVVEGRNHGVATYRSRNYRISNMYIHHFAADGIYLGGDRTPDQNLEVRNVLSSHNARQGLSVIQVQGARIYDSEFSNAGRTDGNYLGHMPMSGVDIEPNFTSERPEERTKDILFEDCIFRDNRGAQITTYNRGMLTSVENVQFSRVTVTAAEDSYQLAVVLAVKNGLIENSEIDTKAGAIYPSYGDGTQVDTTLRGNTIYTRAWGIVSDQPKLLWIENNRLVGQHRQPFTSYMPYLQNTRATFRNNTVFVPKEALATASFWQGFFLLQRLSISAGNEFGTDLSPDSGRYFYVDYSGTVRVDSDTFPSPAIRPCLGCLYQRIYSR
jgi:hypothetical protein